MSNYQLTQEQEISAKWVDIRQQRNKLLSESDWMAVSDRTMSNAEKTYRQELRDLPNQFSNPNDVIFPSKP
jgi:hypothetical protein